MQHLVSRYYFYLVFRYQDRKRSPRHTKKNTNTCFSFFLNHRTHNTFTILLISVWYGLKIWLEMIFLSFISFRKYHAYCIVLNTWHWKTINTFVNLSTDHVHYSRTCIMPFNTSSDSFVFAWMHVLPFVCPLWKPHNQKRNLSSKRKEVNKVFTVARFGSCSTHYLGTLESAPSVS